MAFLRNLRNSFNEKCKKLVENNSELKNDSITAVTNFEMCIREADSENESEFNELNDEFNKEIFLVMFQKGCKRKSLYFACIHRFTENISGCFTTSEFETVEIIARIVKRSLAYSCSKNAKIVNRKLNIINITTIYLYLKIWRYKN